MSANWLSDAHLSEVHFYYHYDGLGSVIALSDSAGRTVEMYEYDVYGNTIILAPTQEPPDTSLYGNPYMFTGRRFDTETGLYYYRARYYSTGIGRFLQVDLIGYVDSMNLYEYCRNNPLNWIDPYGLNVKKMLRELNLSINHTVLGYLDGTEWFLAAGLRMGISGLSKLGDVPDIPVPATQYNPPLVIPTSKISVIFEAIDMSIGSWLEKHAEINKAECDWHFKKATIHGDRFEDFIDKHFDKQYERQVAREKKFIAARARAYLASKKSKGSSEKK